MSRGKPKTRTLTIALPEGELPTEFRIFKAGQNPTRNGYSVLFDDAAAAATMAAQAEHAVDLAIDLEHLSTDPDARHYQPDALGWCRLEVRSGELWAVGVSWTPDGAARLTERRQRFVSPTFYLDADMRLTRVVSIALTAQPATDAALPLVANTRPRSQPMGLTVNALANAVDAIRKLSRAGVPAGTILRTLAEGDAAAGEAAGVNIAELAAAFAIDIDPGTDPAAFIKAILAKLDEVRAKLSGAETPPAETAPADAPAAEEMAAARLMLRMVGAPTFADGALRMNEWRSIVSNHETLAAKNKADQAAIELTERKALVVKLYGRGETPATSGLVNGTLCARLANEPIESLRERVGILTAGGAPGAFVPSPAPEANALTAREIAQCKAKGIDTAEYLKTKAALAARSTRQAPRAEG